MDLIMVKYLPPEGGVATDTGNIYAATSMHCLFQPASPFFLWLRLFWRLLQRITIQTTQQFACKLSIELSTNSALNHLQTMHLA